jgi:CBS domain containing-hemolysin-like protein
MFQTMTEDPDPGSAKPAPEPLLDRFMALWKGSSDHQDEEQHDEESHDGAAHEQRLLSNVAAFRNIRVDDIMVPRAEIFAIAADTELQPLIKLVSEHPHSRIPVFRETLDDVIGVFHIRDILGVLNTEKPFRLADIVRPVPIVAPSMRAVDLLLDMRRTRNHIALVVDEFGGIDGLVTIEDLIEEIVGDIEDEHDRDSFDEILTAPDGSYIVDARMPIEEFEQVFGTLVDEDERDEFDTVGGLIWTLAGHIPKPGEIVPHASGAEFEVLESDHRRIKRIRALRPARVETGQ